MNAKALFPSKVLVALTNGSFASLTTANSSCKYWYFCQSSVIWLWLHVILPFYVKVKLYHQNPSIAVPICSTIFTMCSSAMSMRLYGNPCCCLPVYFYVWAMSKNTDPQERICLGWHIKITSHSISTSEGNISYIVCIEQIPSHACMLANTWFELHNTILNL